MISLLQFLFSAIVFLMIVAVPATWVVARLTSRPAKRTPAEVAKYLRDFIDGTGTDWDWDDFESTSIEDPELERIRREAASAAPPDADMDTLRELLRQADELARR